MTPLDVARFALSLPDTSEEPQLNCSFFRVRGRVFATIPPGRRHLHVFLHPVDSEFAATIHPEFVEPLVWDDHVVGVRVHLANAVPKFVERLVSQAWGRDAGEHILEGCSIRMSGGHRRIVV